MKRFILGLLIGALLFGAIPAIAASVTATATLTTSKVFVDNKQVSVEAYQINGSNYFKLRDFCKAIGIGVWSDESTQNIYIETDKGYDPSYTGKSQATPQTTTTAPKAVENTGGGSTYVWIPRTGSKYHSRESCSNMKNPSYVTLEAAIRQGYTRCSKCW